MKLFTKEIDTKLFEQYLTGSDLENQMVVAKIFNPYGRGTWYLLNSDPEDPEYLWAIVDMDDIEVGSVNRSDLENIRIKPFMLGLERDLSFRQMNALELYEGLNEGKKYVKGGEVEKANFGYLLIADKMKNLAPKSFDAVDEKFAERIKFGMYAEGGEVTKEDCIEIFYVMDEIGKVKTMSTKRDNALSFLQNSLKGDGRLSSRLVLKKDWEDEKINVSNIKNYKEPNVGFYSNDEIWGIGKYADGGGVESENKEMVLNNNKQIAHHTKELQSALKGKNVPAWVVAKVNRSASDLSDATHYMEGQGESYADGGGVEEEEEMDWNKLSDVQEELGKLYKWKNQYGSKGADGKIKQLEERIEYLKTNNKYKNGGGVGDVNQVKIEITEQYNDERGNKKNTTKSYDVNYLVNFPNKEFIELTGTLKPYHTGRDYDYEFEVDYFADQEEENYYDENSEKIENEILNKFYNKKETGGGVGDKWQIKDSKDKYFSVSMQTGKPVWNESPDLGYSYEKQEAEKIKNKLVELGNKNLKVVEYNPNWWKMKTGGGVNGIKITKNEYQFRKDEPNRIYHSYEGTLGDYIFYAETDNSFKSAYGSYGINKGSIYKLSIRKVLDNGMHDTIAEYWNKWDYRTKNAKDGAIRSKIIKYIDSISDEKKGTPKKYADGGGVNITESDIIEGVSFKNKSGTTFIIDKIELDPKFGKLVSSSLLGGKKGNYKDGITDFIAFLNEEKAVKYKSGGKLTGWKHRKK